MKIAVFGVFRNEKTMFPVWYKYYTGIFGAENVYCFDDHSTDGTFDNRPLNYELIPEKKDVEKQRLGVGDYGRLWTFIVNKYHELLNEYRWVIHVDCDDFIVANPLEYKDLKDFIIREDGQQWHRCSAFEVLQLEHEPDLDWNREILCQRNYWIRVTNLDKTACTRISLALRGKTSWVLGNHYAQGHPQQPTNRNLLLIHLHRIDYPTYKNKYFVDDPNIKDDKHFHAMYGGYPLFWQEKILNEHFRDIEANRQFGAHRAEMQEIPKIYKGVF